MVEKIVATPPVGHENKQPVWDYAAVWEFEAKKDGAQLDLVTEIPLELKWS